MISMLLVLASLLTILPFAAMAEDIKELKGEAEMTGAVVMGEVEDLADENDVVVLGSSSDSKGVVVLNSGVTSSVTLIRGKTAKLSVDSSRKKTWSSSKKSVATVSSTGKVTAKGYGTCTITCKLSNGTKLKCKVKVIKAVSFKNTKGTGERAGQWKFDFKNNSTSKTIKRIDFYLKEYNKSGKLLKKTKYYLKDDFFNGPMNVAPGEYWSPEGWDMWVYKSCKTTYKMTYSIYKVYYTDGTTWKP